MKQTFQVAAGYSVGDKAANANFVLLVGADVFWPSGNVYGFIYAGRDMVAPDDLKNRRSTFCQYGTRTECLTPAFDAAKSCYQEAQSTHAVITPNTAWTLENSGITITCNTNRLGYYVVEMARSVVSQVSQFIKVFLLIFF